MLILRCTKKLQKAIGVKSLVPEDAGCGQLGSWTANLVDIAGRPCVLFVNDQTLFNFILPDIPKLKPEQLVELFRDLLRCVLAEEGFALQKIDELIKDYAESGFANTNSKRVLGSLNEIAFMYNCHIEECGVHSYRVPEVIKKMNRVPMTMLNHGYAIEALRALWGLKPD